MNRQSDVYATVSVGGRDTPSAIKLFLIATVNYKFQCRSGCEMSTLVDSDSDTNADIDNLMVLDFFTAVGTVPLM